jgi:hypothetical protein
MPIVPFTSLPNSARVWVFGSDQPVQGAAADSLLAAVDQFLAQWRAHGVPLHCARDWRDERFLAVGVDVTQENASGCSIDGLFRTLHGLEREVGARLLGGGRVFYRADGSTAVASREEFEELIERGEVTAETPVFDTSLTTAASWRTRFEQPAGQSWTAAFF